MSHIVKIREVTGNSLIDLVDDTLRKNKQVIIFVNSKRSAEKVSDDIAYFIKNRNYKFLDTVLLNKISRDIESILERPTAQCKRLAGCVSYGVAFHHAGLLSRQREIIEDSFRNGKIKIIVATPTLAAGVDLPAYRVIIRDLRRYSKGRLSYISVMEYNQQAGRAGRPTYDREGQAIVIASNETEKERIVNSFIHGKIENIYSKLAVEPILRMYVLSLISIGVINDIRSLQSFFSKTFWFYQFEDPDKINMLLYDIVIELKDKGFIQEKGENQLSPTLIGKRVSELYLDPLTAYNFLEGLRKLKSREFNVFSVLSLIVSSLELRPLPSVQKKFYEDLLFESEEKQNLFLFEVPSEFDYEFDDFIKTLNFVHILLDWINEVDEDNILEKYNIRPGELRVKLELVDWLIYSLIELSKIINGFLYVNDLSKLRERLKFGVKEELLSLIKLKGIGKHRARRLYNVGIRRLSDIKKANLDILVKVLGKKVTMNILDQLDMKDKVTLLNDQLEDSKKKSKTSKETTKQSSLTDF